jgi:hypothetical protein
VHPLTSLRSTCFRLTKNWTCASNSKSVISAPPIIPLSDYSSAPLPRPKRHVVARACPLDTTGFQTHHQPVADSQTRRRLLELGLHTEPRPRMGCITLRRRFGRVEDNVGEAAGHDGDVSGRNSVCVPGGGAGDEKLAEELGNRGVPGPSDDQLVSQVRDEL